MPHKILMPALSPTMTEGKLVKWLKKEGDKVKAGQVIAEIETDKATMEVEAVDEGIIGKIYVPAGTDGVKVNTLIAVLLEEGEDKSALDKVSTAAAPVKAVTPANQPAPTMAVMQPVQAKEAGRVFASPLAKRLAKEKGLDLSRMQGSGPHGRIVKSDVEQAKGGGQPSFAPTRGAAPAGPAARTLADAVFPRIDTGSRASLLAGYLLGSALMIGAGLVAARFAVAAERRPLEQVARPLASVD